MGVLLACSGRALDAPDPIDDARLQLVEALAERVDPERLERAIALGWAALDDHGDDPRLLEPLARAYVAKGYASADDTALADLAQAYALGHRCLARNPGWRSRLSVAGGRVVEDVTARLVVEDGPCLAATLLALGLGIQARGPAAWVDLRELAVLSDAAEALDTEQVDWVGPWARGVALTVSPQADESALDAGADAFREATRREPELMTASVDRLAWVGRRSQERSALVRAINAVRQRYSPVLVDHEWALENRRGQERLAALLEELVR